ncbi:kininogen-1 [Scomber japonicus]|uniref:kininogen-1 n=1 Tax=Scomber japonicus TaxID=13676 RepID=UPI002306B9B7|nr:kininogen-1 [Scomber japonicus]XP_053177759.1 kininogen-1 [Scomber japonicus]
MRSGAGLYVLGLLCLYSSVFGQDAVEVQPGVLVFCDDPVVEKAVTSAVHKFNEELTSDNKLALYQILTATKSDSGPDSVYSLQFTTRRSDCPVSSSKPWTDCDYLPIDHKPLACNATVHVTETETDTKQVSCLLDDYIVPEKVPCLGCPEEISETSEDLRVPLTASLSKYNHVVSEHTHLFTFHSVGYATRQVVAGLRYKLRFDMRKSICAKVDHKELNVLCVPDEENVEFSNCNSTVDVAPWRLEAPDPQLECEQGALPAVLTRRRPPGWSPLRNFLFDTVPSPSSPPVLLPPKPSAKEESSEEDTTGSKQAGSPANDDPFHCPSKPWKPFKPVQTGAPADPTEATLELAPAEPSPGTFSDTDLLG